MNPFPPRTEVRGTGPHGRSFKHYIADFMKLAKKHGRLEEYCLILDIGFVSFTYERYPDLKVSHNQDARLLRNFMIMHDASTRTNLLSPDGSLQVIISVERDDSLPWRHLVMWLPDGRNVILATRCWKPAVFRLENDFLKCTKCRSQFKHEPHKYHVCWQSGDPYEKLPQLEAGRGYAGCRPHVGLVRGFFVGALQHVVLGVVGCLLAVYAGILFLLFFRYGVILFRFSFHMLSSC
ncbi:hypothetical protein BGZ63DRAFT_379425 [Mariannaea sp. PMI_226]|nr:hypothetical protein BGZ63DRAFT_379425 [Mariannaea sp. PMI_226]